MNRTCITVAMVICSMAMANATVMAGFEEITMTWTDVQDDAIGSHVFAVGNVESPGGETEGHPIVMQTNPNATNQEQDSATIGADGDFAVSCPFTGGTPVDYRLIAFDENDDYGILDGEAN